MGILKAENVYRSFERRGRRFDAVCDVSLEVPSGKITVISGRSGSGKSTLLNMLAGTLKPGSGTVTMDGRDLYAMNDRENSGLRSSAIGVIPQGKSLVMSLSVLDNVMLSYLLKGSVTPEIRDKATGALGRLGLSGLAEAAPKGLSGGEMRRVSIARVLINMPDVILADEPTGDLDAGTTATVLSLLREEADRGAAVLLVTHETEAYGIADILYEMSEGKKYIK